jgi:hypothetical protein
MADWVTISSLATAAGTLVLAGATFSAVRSGNRSARIAEEALQQQRRPLLVHARPEDPAQKVLFADGHWIRAQGAAAAFDEEDGAVYLGLPVRNVGAGIAVLQGWYPWPELMRGADHGPPPVGDFRRQIRDIYIAPGDLGMWQGALRGGDGAIHDQIAAARAENRPFTIDLLYSDQVGGQRTISRFGLTPMGEGRWLGNVGQHWTLDGPSPR